jgi:tetratricopeptide (TPR) repeat protein
MIACLLCAFLAQDADKPSGTLDEASRRILQARQKDDALALRSAVRADRRYMFAILHDGISAIISSRGHVDAEEEVRIYGGALEAFEAVPEPTELEKHQMKGLRERFEAARKMTKEDAERCLHAYQARSRIRRLKEVKDAEDDLKQSIEQLGQLGDRLYQGYLYDMLASLYMSTKRWEDAIQTFQIVHKVMEEFGARDDERITLGNIATAYERLERYEDAIKYYEMTLRLAQSLQDGDAEQKTLASLGKVCKFAGRFKEALSYFDRLVPMIRETGDKALEAMLLELMAETSESLGNLDQSRGYLEAALKAKGDDPEVLNRLGSLHRRSKRHAQALECYEAALARPIHEKDGPAQRLHITPS